MAEKVTIKFITETQQAGTQLRELGEKVTAIGMRISAAFTLPLAGLFAALKNNDVFAKAFQPIQDAFGKIIGDLATALIPVINELKPALIGLAGSIGAMLKSFVPAIVGLIPTFKELVGFVQGVVEWFTNLSAPTKDLIVKIFLFGAVLGPVLVLIGQMIWMAGTLTQLLPKLALGLWTGLAPILAIGAAIYAVIKLLQMEEWKQIWSLLVGGAAGAMTGSAAVRSQVTANTYKNMGGGGDTSTGDFVRGIFGGVGAPASGGGVTIPLIYAPPLSTASQQELEKNLGPIIADILRNQQGR